MVETEKCSLVFSTYSVEIVYYLALESDYEICGSFPKLIHVSLFLASRFLWGSPVSPKCVAKNWLIRPLNMWIYGLDFLFNR